MKVQFLSPAVRSAGLVLPGEFDLIDPIYWVVAAAATALFVVNSSDGGTSGPDPTPPSVSPDGDDPDKWKRYLKWAALAVGVIAGVVVVVYLANRYGTTPDAGGGTPPPSPPVTPPTTGPITNTADLIQRLNRGGGTPAELEQTLRDLAGGTPGGATPSGGISWAQVAELVNRPGGEPPVVVRPRVTPLVDRPSQWIIQDPRLARAFESGDRINVLPNPVVQGEWRHLVWMHPTELNLLAKNHPGWDYQPTSRAAAGRYCMKWAYQDVFTTDDRQHESFKSIAIQHAAHRFGILESEYPGWCRYYRTRFEEVGPEEVALFKERTKEMFVRNGGAHHLALYHRSLENWELQRDHLAEGFAFEYKQRYRRVVD